MSSERLAGQRLSIEADLHLTIDGVEAELVGSGDALTLRTDEPARLVTALRRSGLRWPSGRVRRLIAAPGLHGSSVILEGPRGRVAHIAPARRGVSARGLPVVSRLRIHRPQDLIRAPARWSVVVAGVVVALTVGWLRRRRRRDD